VKLSLIADQAIGEAQIRQSDGLGFDAYARVLAQAALDTTGPFTVGIFGEWGTGKTSLMRLIESQLAGRDNVVTVWFNAWRYEKEEHPIVPLVGTIVRELEKHKSLEQKFGGSTRALIRALRAVAYGFSAKSTVKVPGFAEIEASFVAKDMIDREERLSPDPLLDRSLYYGAFNTLEKVRLEDELRVVILIDDLDRCFPDQAIRLLESIKLVLAQPGFIFVLGVARQVIEGYLQHRYSSEFGIKDFKGQLYLDKMVQLPFHIPPNSGRMEGFCASILADQPGEVSDEIGEILPTIAEALGGNPRAVIRFVNNILIDMAINSELADASLMERIPLDYFAISRCLEDRWPEVFSSLAASQELAEDVSAWEPSFVQVRAADSDDAARIAAAMISDRNLAALLLSDRGKDWLENSDLRMASIGFLQTQSRTSPLDVAESPVKYDAFLSYAAEDRPQVVNLATGLSNMGLRIFFDVNIPIGTNWAQELAYALNKSDVICFCIGGRAVTEAQVKELTEATARAQSAILPILLPGAETDNIPSNLAEIQWADLREGIEPSDVRNIANAIKRLRRQARRDFGDIADMVPV
jgi:KAP family P-loop domain/TIR domain